MASLWGRFMSGMRGFREGWLSADASTSAEFGEWGVRCARYALLWAYFDNTVYRRIHSFSDQLKTEYGLYKYIRSLYNPSARLADFWQTHIWGGRLDAEAGDGSVPSAIPISTQLPELRPAIARLWRDSNWSVNKDITPLWGSVLGDVAIRVVDDAERQKVYLENVHPSLLKEVTVDPFGHVKGYVLEETRDDPRIASDDPNRMREVRYTEKVTRGEGDEVLYETLMNDAPFPWYNGVSSWVTPYGFVPLVLIQHVNVGIDWAWSELFASLPKAREVDDLASKLSDQIRKGIDPIWLFGGVDDPKTKIKTTGPIATTDSPDPGRQSLPALYGPVGATAHPLVANVDVGGTLRHIASLLEQLEQDYPELQVSKIMLSGTSGRARLIAQQMVEPKVLRRREGYDSALVRAQQMAVAIGGWRQYESYAGFGLESYAAGQLDHCVAPRDVFSRTFLDSIEEEAAFWHAAGSAGSGGCPLPLYLERMGWSDDKIARISQWRAYEQAQLEQARILAAAQAQAALTGG